MEGEGNGHHRKPPPVLTRQLSVIHSSNLQNIIKAKEENEAAADAGTSKTLATVLASEKRGLTPSPRMANRTLIDIIRDESTENTTTNTTDVGATHSVNWKTFKDRLILRRATAAFFTSSSSSSSSFPPSVQALNLVPPTPTVPTITNSAVEPPRAAAEPVRVSLMTLLEQTDRMAGLRIREDDPEPAKVVKEPMEVEMEEEEEEEGEMVHVCCVCMVRHKGAAFIPCGHTFCRLCSRELWVSRGNCPLCNGFILEILDIF